MEVNTELIFYAYSEHLYEKGRLLSLLLAS